jgi:hypothetical protein
MSVPERANRSRSKRLHWEAEDPRYASQVQASAFPFEALSLPPPDYSFANISLHAPPQAEPEVPSSATPSAQQNEHDVQRKEEPEQAMAVLPERPPSLRAPYPSHYFGHMSLHAQTRMGTSTDPSSALTMQPIARATQVPTSEAVVGPEGGPLDADLSERIAAQRGSGAPLAEPTRSQMERSFGFNFANVRLHNDSPSHTLNRSLSANAFTTGRDIFLGPGASSDDSHLLAHELTHVVQQPPSGNGPLQVGPATSPAEQEAEAMGEAVASNPSLGAETLPTEEISPPRESWSLRPVLQRQMKAQAAPTSAPSSSPGRSSQRAGNSDPVSGYQKAVSNQDWAAAARALRAVLQTRETELPDCLTRTDPDALEFVKHASDQIEDAARGHLHTLLQEQEQRNREGVPASLAHPLASPAATDSKPSQTPIVAAGMLGPVQGPVKPPMDWFDPYTNPFDPVPVVESAEVAELEIAAETGVAIEATAVAAGTGTALAAAGAGTALVVIGCIALGVAIVGVGAYLGWKYLLSNDGKPIRRLTPQEERRVLPSPPPAHFPGQQGDNAPPIVDPGTTEPLFTPSPPDQIYTPMIDPITGEPLHAPGPAHQRDETLEAAGYTKIGRRNSKFLKGLSNEQRERFWRMCSQMSSTQQEAFLKMSVEKWESRLAEYEHYTPTQGARLGGMTADQRKYYDQENPEEFPSFISDIPDAQWEVLDQMPFPKWKFVMELRKSTTEVPTSGGGTPAFIDLQWGPFWKMYFALHEPQQLEHLSIDEWKSCFKIYSRAQPQDTDVLNDINPRLWKQYSELTRNKEVKDLLKKMNHEQRNRFLQTKTESEEYLERERFLAACIDIFKKALPDEQKLLSEMDTVQWNRYPLLSDADKKALKLMNPMRRDVFMELETEKKRAPLRKWVFLQELVRVVPEQKEILESMSLEEITTCYELYSSLPSGEQEKLKKIDPHKWKKKDPPLRN